MNYFIVLLYYIIDIMFILLKMILGDMQFQICTFLHPVILFPVRGRNRKIYH